MFVGSASQYKNAGAVAQKALPYLNPAIAASSTLFNEIDRDTGKFTKFVVNTGNLVTDALPALVGPERARPAPVDHDRRSGRGEGAAR